MRFRFDQFELDTDTFELHREDAPVRVEPQVLEVLAYLVEHHDRLVPKQELLDQIWPDRFVGEAVLNSRVMAARKAIGDSGREQRLIRTTHGRGFRFVANVTAVSDGDAGAGHEEDSGAASPAAVAATPAAPPVCEIPGLDPPRTSFVGRDTELARLDELLALPSARLINIVGPGGVGKTRLAIEAACRHRAAGGEVAFVSLEAVHAVDGVPRMIAATVGLASSARSAMADLARRIGGRSLLLVLDNFEHLAATGAPLLSQLLSGCGRLRILLTSRAVLGLQEEWTFPVGGLDTEATEGASPAASQLFLERAHQARGRPLLPSADDGAVERICTLVDGMPLAIELAASLTRYMEPVEIAERVASDISVLRWDLTNVPVRHRSVPGLLAESVRFLTVDQGRALLALSVFERSFDPVAAEVVAEAPLKLVSGLVDRSLVQPLAGRFALHPLARQFAREQAGPAFPSLQDRHAAYYLGRLAELGDVLQAAGQLAALDEIDQDYANITAAWRWAVSQARLQQIEDAAHALFLFMQFRARYAEAHELLQSAIDLADETRDDGRRLLAAVLPLAAWVAMRIGKGREAGHMAKRAIALQRDYALPPRRGIAANPWSADAMLHWGAGDYPGAYDCASVAVESARDAGDDAGEAFALWLAAGARLRTVELEAVQHPEGPNRYRATPGDAGEGRLREARALLGRASEIVERRGERWLCSVVETDYGFQASALGEPARAADHHHRAFELRAELNDRVGMGTALVYEADSWTDLGDLDRASDLHDRARELVRASGDLVTLTEVERSMARVAVYRRDYPGAAQLVVSSIDRALQLGFSNNVIGALRSLGDVLLACGYPQPAADLFAFIRQHPATTPFARALAEQSWSMVATQLPAAGVQQALERAASFDLASIARHGTEAARSATDLDGRPLLP